MESSFELHSSNNDSHKTEVISIHQQTAQVISSNDQTDLARSGKKEVLKRNFGLLSMTGFSCGLMASWEAMITLFQLGLVNGGSAGLIYGLLFTWTGNICVFSVIGELSSMVPTAGGQYHWVSILAPRSAKKFLSHITGWMTSVGWIAGVTAMAGFCSGLIQTVVALNYPSYTPTPWRNTLVFEAALLLAFIVNVCMARTLPILQICVLITHVAGFVIIMISLIYLAPHAGNVSALFRTFSNHGGWRSEGLFFFIGLNGSALAFIGTDGPVHMSEEAKKASLNVPRAMLISLFLNGCLAFAMLITVLVCAGDPTAYASASFPFIPLLAHTFQSVPAATGLSCIIITILLCVLIGSLASASRVVWAFSRDRGLPGWKTLGHINSRITIPVAAVITVTILCALLGLINIGSPRALNDSISLTLQALYCTYFNACALLLIRRLRGDIANYGSNNTELAYTWGPWHLPGIFGVLINIVACFYLFIIGFFSLWPSTTPVTVPTMNYSIVAFLGAFVIAVVYYLGWARKIYKGPIVEVNLVD